MKKYKTIFLVVFLVVILPLTFLSIKFFFNKNNLGYTKINWEKPKEESKDNIILAPSETTDLALENIPIKSEKAVEKIMEKALVNELAIEKKHFVSWGFAKTAKRTIDTVIIHSSYDALSGNPYSLDGLIKEYQQYGVAPHYLIDRKGIIYRLVEDKNTAYHAGKSQTPDGRKNVNDFSIGIEIMNTKTDSPTEEQYAALQKLIDFLKKEYKIKYILGHNQIAEGRKDDPWNFDWQKIKE